MARETTHDSLAFNLWFMSGQFGHARLEENLLYSLDSDSHIAQYVEAVAPGTTVRLPPLTEGKFFLICNTGSEDLEIETANGSPLFTIAAGTSNIVHTEGASWKLLVSGAVIYNVFGPEGLGASTGLVPSPGAAQAQLRFLGSDAQWHGAFGNTLLDGYSFITDGTNTANATGNDTFRLRSSSGKITITVTDAEAVFGDNANLSVNEAAVDHNALLNFVANKHIDHTTVSITGLANGGIGGGGTIAASRTLSVDFTNLPLVAPVLADRVLFGDVSDSNLPKYATFTTLNGIIDHNSLLNYVADQHVAHSGVSITPQTGLTGGGTIAATRTISLDFSALPTQAEAMASGDLFPFYDLSGTTHKKISWASLNAALDHNALTNYVADQHVAHSGVTLTAGAGLTGGGTIAASRTFDVGAGTGIVVAADTVGIDAATTTEVLTGTSVAKVNTPDSVAALWEKGADVASAGTVSLGEGGFFHITGTVTITDIDWAIAKDGRVAFVVFDGILTLTHNATTLKLPTGANIVTAAGDRAIFVQDASDNVICLFYQRASGAALAGSGGALTDADYGDITVSGAGTVMTIDPNVVTYAKMQDISATSRILGRITAGAGDTEELTGSNVRTITGLATTDTPQFAGIELGAASDTTIARPSAGNMSIEGNIVYRAGGTDVPVADGGTGVSSLTAYAVMCGGTTSTNPVQSIAGVGTSGQVLTSNGAGALPTFQASAGGSLAADIQTFNASGTWTKPAGAYSLALIECWGSGGSGGCRASTGSATGGGGGSYTRRIVPFSSLGATETVTVGAGGAAVASSDADGNVGNTTSFGSLLSAYGGGGGKNGAVSANRLGGAGAGLIGTAVGAASEFTNVGGQDLAFIGILSGSDAVGEGNGASGACISSSNNLVAAGNSFAGGPGGGATCSTGPVNGSGGTSKLAGTGGNGNNPGTAGTQPAAGGGGGRGGGASGKGGDGRVVVTCWA